MVQTSRRRTPAALGLPGALLVLLAARAPADEGPRAGGVSPALSPALPLDLLAGAFGSGGGQAAAPAKAEEKKDLPWGGYDRGFFVQSTDGKFRLQFLTRIQARYTYFGKDTQGSDGSDRDESYFELERARIGLSGNFFDPRIKFKIEFDAETDAADKGAMTDAYVSYDAASYATIGIGQFKPYFLRQEATSSSRQQRVERSLSNEFFNIDRNIGLWSEGYLDEKKTLFYSVALTNGIDTVNQAPGGGGTQLVDQNLAYIGKFDAMLLGEDHRDSYSESDLKISDKPFLVVGASALHERFDPSHVGSAAFISTEGQVTSFGLDGIFKYKGASITGDYVGRWYDQDGDGSGAVYCHGFNVQGGYFILPKEKVELTARYSQIWGNEGPQNGDGVEIGPGINWFFAGSHNGKLQLDVAWVNISDNLPSNTEELRLGPNDGFGTTAAGFSEGEQGVLTRIQVQINF